MPDNVRVAVIKACLYDPQVNRSYAELTAYCDSAVLPSRPWRPRGKAKVEAAVLIVERWLFGRLRHCVFHSLAELNAAITELLADLNDRHIRRVIGQTRRQLFEVIGRPALRPLPREPYVFVECGSGAPGSTITSRSSAMFARCPTVFPCLFRRQRSSSSSSTQFRTRLNISL